MGFFCVSNVRKVTKGIYVLVFQRHLDQYKIFDFSKIIWILSEGKIFVEFCVLARTYNLTFYCIGNTKAQVLITWLYTGNKISLKIFLLLKYSWITMLCRHALEIERWLHPSIVLAFSHMGTKAKLASSASSSSSGPAVFPAVSVMWPIHQCTSWKSLCLSEPQFPWFVDLDSFFYSACLTDTLRVRQTLVAALPATFSLVFQPFSLKCSLLLAIDL